MIQHGGTFESMGWGEWWAVGRGTLSDIGHVAIQPHITVGCVTKLTFLQIRRLSGVSSKRSPKYHQIRVCSVRKSIAGQ